MLAIQSYLIGKGLQNGLSHSELKNFYDINYIEDFDFTIVSNPLSDNRDLKGKKLSQKYAINGNDNIVFAEKIFTDALDVDGRIEHINIDFVWYEWAIYDTITSDYLPLVVKHTKHKEVKLSRGQRAKLLKKRRSYSIDDLIQSSEDTPVEPYVHALIKHYKSEKDLFIDDGSTDLIDAINNETDVIMISHLDLIIDDVGTTVKDVIMTRLI